ncbi:hypothetical protein HMSSN139_08530 [Paenibacillus sp. HMSSN-139]|nr:hypothetical protein HMSSN139_08530 [Paenibacillus sp. HMSSN-139]
MKKIIDHMIANGDIEPMIVVTPTFYGGKNDTALFHEELIQTIMPLVETKYRTYAKSASLDDLKASRAHRAFGGFSMGSVTTWYTFIHNLDYFKYYLPLSGDSWGIGVKGAEAASRRKRRNTWPKSPKMRVINRRITISSAPRAVWISPIRT